MRCISYQLSCTFVLNLKTWVIKFVLFIYHLSIINYIYIYTGSICLVQNNWTGGSTGSKRLDQWTDGLAGSISGPVLVTLHPPRWSPPVAPQRQPLAVLPRCLPLASPRCWPCSSSTYTHRQAALALSHRCQRREERRKRERILTCWHVGPMFQERKKEELIQHPIPIFWYSFISKF